MGSKLTAKQITYRALLGKYLRPQARRALTMALLLLGNIALQLVNPQILRVFIDDITTGTGSGQTLLLLGLLFLASALVLQGLAIGTTYLSENLAWTATNQLRTDLVAHCLRLELAFHKVHTSGELMERIDGDVDTLSTFFSRAIVLLLGNGLLILGVIISLAFADWRLGLGVGIFAGLGVWVLSWLRGLIVKRGVIFRQKQAEFFGFLGEQLAGTEDMRANGATGFVMRRFYEFMRVLQPAQMRVGMGWYHMFSVTMLTFGLGNALALGLGVYLWQTGVISLGTVYLAFYFVNLLADPIEQIRNQFQELQRASSGVVRIKQLLEIQPTIVDGPGTQLPEGPLSVEFAHVSFAYHEGRAVIEGLNLRLESGRLLGVLGRTGSGKTTLTRLLLRLYDAQEGHVLLGGVPIGEARLSELRGRIGMVTQDIQLFHATLRENLTLFNPAIGDERLLTVLGDLGLLSWYHALPDGLDTMLGEAGEGLSAGEAQLLAFARVFLADPGLIILDEASSRLDPATEQLIERAVSRLLTRRTGLIIAHRLATVQRCDEILVLEAGRVLEHGPRAALAADPNSRYARLLRAGLETMPEKLELEAEQELALSVEENV